MKKYHALVVDDHEWVCDDVRGRLESLGHACDSVRTQKDALEKLEENSYDYIILDLEIPFSHNKPSLMQNGINLLNALRAINKSASDYTPAIVMTSHGHDSPDLAVEVLSEHKAVHFVKKPFPLPASGNTLEDKIMKTLELLESDSITNMSSLPKNIFRRKGDFWQARYDGRNEFFVSPCKGAEYLHKLLEAQGERLSAASIVFGAAHYFDMEMDDDEAEKHELRISSHIHLDSLDTVSDRRALQEYGKELEKVNAEIKKARKENNNAMLTQLEEEKAGLKKGLNESMHRGKFKKIKDKRKNIRDAFRNNINRLIEEIKRTDCEFGEHLSATLTFGDNPSYKPLEKIPWSTRPVTNN
jgi:CheY-like chemotaxis protein